MLEFLHPYLPILLFVFVFIFMAIRMPIGIALGLAAMLVAYLENGRISSLATAVVGAMNNKFLLTAIPFFILSSVFLTSGGTAQRIVRFAVTLCGHIKGGVAAAGVLACMLFAALSGSSPATVAAIGPIAIEGMQKAGYSKKFAAGIIATAGTLGILIPPSIVMVVYAAATNESVGRMFLAGIIPGMLAGFMLIGGIRIAMIGKPIQTLSFAGWRRIFRDGHQAFFGLLLTVLVLCGIYQGWFTPTEAAAFAAVYAFFIAVVIYRTSGFLKSPHRDWVLKNEKPHQAIGRNLWQVSLFLPLSIFHSDTRKALIEASRLSLVLMFVIFNTLIFSHVLTEQQIPQYIADYTNSANIPPWVFLLIINIILLIGGQFMEPSGLLLIVAPIVHPIALALGIDPIHLGIIMVVNMEIGMITPPVGLNLFVTSTIAKMGIIDVMRAALPWVGILFVFLIFITYIPEISLFLPTRLMG